MAKLSVKSTSKKITIFILTIVIVVIVILLASVLFSTIIPKSSNTTTNNTTTSQYTLTTTVSENSAYKQIQTISGNSFDSSKLPYNYKYVYIVKGQVVDGTPQITIKRCFGSVQDTSITKEVSDQLLKETEQNLDLKDNQTFVIIGGVDESC